MAGKTSTIQDGNDAERNSALSAAADAYERSRQIEFAAAEVRIRAERRLGQLLGEHECAPPMKKPSAADDVVAPV